MDKKIVGFGELSVAKSADVLPFRSKKGSSC